MFQILFTFPPRPSVGVLAESNEFIMFLRTFLVVTWDLNGDDTGWGTVTTTKVQALHNEGLNIVDVHDTLFHKKTKLSVW